MAMAQATPRGYLERPRPSGLADVIDIILDKGLVIDAYVRVSLIGIEILTIDARIVIASVDTYLRFAEAVNRLDLAREDDSQGLPELMESVTEGGSKSKTKGALEGVKDKLTGDDDEDEGDEKQEKQKSSSRSSSRGSSSRSRSRSKSGSGSSRSKRSS
jgi:gas vesicle structural protein